MKKRFAAAFLCLVMMLSFFVFSSFAAEISDVKTDLPLITATVSAPSGAYDSIDAGKVKAKLDGQELKVNSAEVKGGTNEWIFLIDTSKSTKAYFEAEKNAVLATYKALGKNDKLSLYTFDTVVNKVLDGSEKPEDAEKKIKELACNGQDTVFYESLDKLLAVAKESKSDNIIPVVFSDGVDTLSKKIDKKAIGDKLAAEKIPVYGFYADSLKGETAKAFKDMLAKSGGSAEAFTAKNATQLLSKKNAANEIIITAAASGDIKANDKAVLTLDLGDGKEIKKEAKVEAWSSDTVAPEILSAEADTTANTVTVKFSEAVLGADKKDNYTFTCTDESKVEITDIKAEKDTAVITVDSLDRSGVTLKISGITDKALNAAEEKSFNLTEVKSEFPIIPVIIAAVLVIALIIFFVLKNHKKSDKPENNKPEKSDKPEGKKAEAKPGEKADEKDEKKAAAEAKKAEAEAKKAKKKKEKEEAQFQFYFVDKK